MISEAGSWAGSRWNSRKPPEKNKREERENRIKYTYKTGDIQKMRKISSEKLEQELKRLEQMREYERKYEEYSVICGIDEAGRGPLAGPVVAAAAVLPKDAVILWLNDSKKLSGGAVSGNPGKSGGLWRRNCKPGSD